MQTKLNSGWVYRDRIAPKDAGQTVLDFYARRYRHSSVETWRDRLESEQIYLGNGKGKQPATADQVLETGQALEYHRPPWQEPAVPLDIQILYEDADLLVVSKPSGLPVMPAGGFLEHTLLRQLQRQYAGDVPPVPIHRLGRGTSGLMLLARSPLAKSQLTQQMRDRRLEKIYWAIATGLPPKGQFTISTPIGKLPHPTLGTLYGAVPDSAANSTGKFAHSICRVVSRDTSQQQSLIEVKILTGRPHQIRIHLAAAGFPLASDPLYQIGGIPILNAQPPHPLPGDCGYSLHARRLTFRHPRGDRPIIITTPPPPDFFRLLSD
ncbi:MAG: RluA family pseudouridine synthase [Cyanobacteria bacterium P01_D01_bin.73]